MGKNASVTVTGTNNLFGPPIVSAASAQLSPQLCKQLLPYLGLKQVGTACNHAATKATPFDLIKAAVARMKEKGGVTPAVKSPGAASTDNTGQSFADISTTVLGPQHMGTAEQYATFVALLARAVGLQSRVVTGFKVSPSATTAVLKPDSSYTWTEVYANGRWQLADATPTRVGKGSPESAALADQPLATDKSTGGDCQPPNCKVVVHPYSPVGTGNAFLTLLMNIGIVLSGLFLLSILWALGVSAMRRRRQRKRRNGTPVQQVRAAVSELLALRREFGLGSRLGSATSTELVTTVQGEVNDDDGEAAQVLVDQMNLAFYGVDPHDDVAPDAVWEWVDWVRGQYRELASRRSRIRYRMFYARRTA
jgi:hypothetical protein